MHADSTFEVTDFTPTDYVSPIATGSTVGHAHLTKRFAGDLDGRSATQFSFAYDDATGVGTYVATEAFEGTLGGRQGSFAFVHSATTDGPGSAPRHELLVIAPGSGAGDLVGITGTGTLRIEDDGTHRLTLDYEIA